MEPNHTSLPDTVDDGGVAVDEEILGELFELFDDGTPDGLIGACDLFLLGVPVDLAEVKSALATGPFGDAGQMAHKLRGTAGAFGAARLGRMAGRLEEMCRHPELAADPGSPAALVREMEVEFRSFRAILTARLASSTSG